MELLVKNVENKENPRQDNSDKKQLFERGRRPRSAAEHKEDWSFIEDESIRTNISYQMQYLEFQVLLYNDYQIYLTVESLSCKNIMAIIGGTFTVFGMLESSIHAAVTQTKRRY